MNNEEQRNLTKCINSGQVSAAQVVAHAEVNFEIVKLPPLPRPDVVSSDEDFGADIHSYSDELLEKYAIEAVHINTSKLTAALAAERAEVARLREALTAMVKDGWLAHGPEGMSPAQQKVHAALTAPGEKHE